MPTSGLPDLIALAYESACDPGGLEGFVAETGRYFRADAACMGVWPRRDPDSLLAVSVGLDTEALASWLARADDPASLFQRLQTATQLQPFETAMPPPPGAGGPASAVLAVLIEADAHNVCALMLIRSAPGLFSPAEQENLRELASYMQRAIGINQRFIRVFAEHRATRLLLDAAPRGIVLLGQRGQATYANDEARRICNSGDGISLSKDQLRLDDDDAMAGLQDFLAQARAHDADHADLPSAGMRVRRPSDAPPYQLIAYGLASDPRQAAIDDREGLAVAMLHDPSVASMPDEQLLHTYFDLTPAEAQLAQTLCAGRSLPAAARQASISINTARTHLRSVFQKVGVHSQAALVQRVAQSLHFGNPVH